MLPKSDIHRPGLIESVVFRQNLSSIQGRNELYGIRVHSAGIWDHKPWDQDQ